MPTAERSKTFDFTDPAIWTLTGDATIADHALTVSDPIVTLIMNVHNWTDVPEADENGDAILKNGTTYLATEHDGSPIQLDDGIFSYWAKLREPLSTALAFATYMRYGGRAEEKLQARYKQGTGMRVIGADGAEDARESLWGNDWGSPTWREFIVRVLDDEIHVRMGVRRAVTHENVDKTDEGTVGLYQNDSDEPVIVGNGGAKDPPFIAHRRVGACELKAANGYLIPRGTESLDRIVAIAETAWGISGKSDPGDVDAFAVPLQYRFVGDAEWTDVPGDGDMSDVTFTAGTSILLVRVNDGNGAGLDNGGDPRYAPKVHAIVLTYEVGVATYATDDEIREVLTNIIALLNEDETLAAYDGWGGAKLHWRELMALRPARSCGVMVVWNRSPERTLLHGQTDGVEQNVKTFDHDIDVIPWWRHDKDLTTEILSDPGLLTLAQDVRNALRRSTLGDTVKITGIDDSEPLPIQYGLEPEDVLPGVRIGIVVQSKLYEGT